MGIGATDQVVDCEPDTALELLVAGDLDVGGRPTLSPRGGAPSKQRRQPDRGRPGQPLHRAVGRVRAVTAGEHRHDLLQPPSSPCRCLEAVATHERQLAKLILAGHAAVITGEHGRGGHADADAPLGGGCLEQHAALDPARSMADKMAHPARVGDISIHDRLDHHLPRPVLGQYLERLAEDVAVIQGGKAQRAQQRYPASQAQPPLPDQHTPPQVQRSALAEDLARLHRQRGAVDGHPELRPVRRDHQLGCRGGDDLKTRRGRNLRRRHCGRVKDSVKERRRGRDGAPLLHRATGAEVAVHERERSLNGWFGLRGPAISHEQPAGVLGHLEQACRPGRRTCRPHRWITSSTCHALARMARGRRRSAPGCRRSAPA